MTVPLGLGPAEATNFRSATMGWPRVASSGFPCRSVVKLSSGCVLSANTHPARIAAGLVSDGGGAGVGAVVGAAVGAAAGGGETCADELGELSGGFGELESFAGFLPRAASKQITKATARNDFLGFKGAPTVRKA